MTGSGSVFERFPLPPHAALRLARPALFTTGVVHARRASVRKAMVESEATATPLPGASLPTAVGSPVIVLTEAPDNPGTSVTNRAERCFYLAGRRLGSPEGDVHFVEHYPGHEGVRDPVLDGEHLDWVQFDEAPDGSPVLVPLMVNGQNVGMAFQHPEWRRRPRGEPGAGTFSRCWPSCLSPPKRLKKFHRKVGSEDVPVP
jgi:hypothetical protein